MLNDVLLTYPQSNTVFERNDKFWYVKKRWFTIFGEASSDSVLLLLFDSIARMDGLFVPSTFYLGPPYRLPSSLQPPCRLQPSSMTDSSSSWTSVQQLFYQYSTTIIIIHFNEGMTQSVPFSRPKWKIQRISSAIRRHFYNVFRYNGRTLPKISRMTRCKSKNYPQYVE